MASEISRSMMADAMPDLRRARELFRRARNAALTGAIPAKLGRPVFPAWRLRVR
jgi:hypothetical protein